MSASSPTQNESVSWRSARLVTRHSTWWPEVAQQAQEAGAGAFQVGGAVHCQAQAAAIAQKTAQDVVHVKRAEREQGEVGIEQVQRVPRARHAGLHLQREFGA